MERASRLFVIGSIGVAGVTHAWLASGRPGLVPAAAAVLVASGLLARVSLAAALVAVLAFAYLTPALTYLAFGASDYHTTLIWLSALAGPVLVHADLRRWHLPPPWRLPFAAWALLIALSWPIVAGRELDFTWLAARVSAANTAAFEAPPRLAAAWIVIVSLSQMLGILWVDLLWARFGHGQVARAERLVIAPLAASAALGALVGVYQGLADLTFLNLAIWTHVGRAGGLMLDANTFGIGAAMWGPAAVALVWRRQGPAWVAAALYLLSGAAMWVSGSRTALLAFSVATVGVIVGLAQRRGLWQPRLAPIGLLIGTALLVLAMALAPRGGNSPTPLQRVFDRLPRLEAAELGRFADEMWTRFGYGQAASSMTADYPVTGVGIGAFHVVSADYLHRDLGRTLAPDNAQNWWRHQIAELGFLGALPSLWISVLLVAALWRGEPYAHPPGAATIVRTVLIGVGLASLLGVPTQHPVSWLSFVTLMYWLPAMPGAAPPAAPPAARWRWAAVFALALLVAAGQWRSAGGDLDVVSRARRSGVPFSYGLSPPEGLSEFGELRWAARRAVSVTPAPNRWLQLTVWAPQPDVAERPVSFDLALDERRVIEHTLASRAPVTYYVEMPGGQRTVLLELSASRELVRDRALQVATAWMREPPPGASSAQVVRQPR